VVSPVVVESCLLASRNKKEYGLGTVSLCWESSKK
jgi:hypothetical protein